jgi:hypothetical protein
MDPITLIGFGVATVIVAIDAAMKRTESERDIRSIERQNQATMRQASTQYRAYVDHTTRPYRRTK